MRRLLVLLVLLASPAFATTFHVSPSGTCPNNTHHTGGDPDITGPCLNGGACGGTSTPCCTLAQAVARMSANGDLVMLHQGTYTSSGVADTDGSCAGPAGNTYFAIFPKNGLSATPLTGTTLRAAGGDVPTLTQTQDSGILIVRNGTTVRGLVINDSTSHSGDGSQVAAIRLCDIDQSSGDGSRSDGSITGTVTNVDVDGNTINYLTQCATCASGGIGIETKGATRVIVENNTITGKWDFGIHVRDTAGDTSLGGVIIRGNHLTGNKASCGGGAQRAMVLEDLGAESSGDATNASQNSSMLIYNNTVFMTYGQDTSALCPDDPPPHLNQGGSDYPVFFREIAWKVFMWNNVLRSGTTGLWFQDDLCNGPSGGVHYHDEQYRIFNNTFWPALGSGVDAVEWNAANNAKLTNNIFSGYSQRVLLKTGLGVEQECPTYGCCSPPSSYGGYTCTTSCSLAGSPCATVGVCRDDAQRNATDSVLTNNNCSPTTNCSNLEGGNAITETGTVQATPSLTADGHLTGNQALINAGTSDPLGQGANVCSVSYWGGSVSCTTDIDGAARGTSWDIGADELGSTTAVCGNGVPELTSSCTAAGIPYTCCTGSGTGSCENCDDGNTVTETACPYQLSGPNSCTLCSADCSTPLSLTGPYCGDGIIQSAAPAAEICDGSLLNGQTCLSLGFTGGGTLACASDCHSYNTNGCSVAATPKTLNGVTLNGGVVIH